MSKRFYLFCLTIVVCGLCAHAQLPGMAAASPSPAPVHHSLSMEVNVVGSGGGAKASGDTTTQGHRTVLSIDLRNFGQQPDQVQLEWYFFAAGAAGPKEYVFDSSTSNVSLRAGETQDITASSKELKTSVTRTTSGYWSGGVQYVNISRTEGGEKVKGWLVRLMADGKAIQVVASDPKYEAMGRHLQDYQPPGGNQGNRGLPGLPGR